MLSKCLVCNRAGLKITFNICNIAYFNVLVLGEKKPARFTPEIDSLEDMSARVVRSAHSTVEVV